MGGQGWFKFYRELLDKPIWTTSTPEQKTILITLIAMANHKENEWEFKGEKYVVQPGQFITSLPSITEKCGKDITIQNVRTALKRFEKYEFLTDESTNRNRLITIVNWVIYQGEDGEPNSEANRQLTGNQQATNRQLTANKNVKNKENDKNDKEYILSAFAEFWSMYPIKKGKKDAEKKFITKAELHGVEAILNGARAYIQECRSKNTFIKHPTTFLNGEHYNDEFGSNLTGKQSLFAQGEESKQRQQQDYKPLVEDTDISDEDLPY